VRVLLVLLCAAVVACPKSTSSPDAGRGDAADLDAADLDDAAEADVPTVWDGGPRFVGTRSDMIDLLIVTEEDATLQAPLAAGIPWITRALVESGVDAFAWA
jgi:hypothetical protein